MAVTDIVQKLIGYGVPANQANILGAVAGAESNYNPKALGDKNLGGSVGLFQIHLPSHADKLKKWTGSSNRQDWVNWLQDPDNNAYAASQVYKSQGLGAWTAYNTGAYKSYLGGQGLSRGGSREQQPTNYPKRGYSVPMLSNLDYFREVKRKRLANEPLTQQFNQPRYEQGARQAQANLVDILQKLSAPPPRPASGIPRYGEEVRRYNAFADAPLLAQAISAYQGSQRPEDITFGQRTRMDEARQQAMLNALTKRKTIADITGIDPETGQPSWDAQSQIANLAASAQKQAAAGSSGKALTAGERKQLATKTYLEAGLNRYKELVGKRKYPLYYAVNSMLNDPEWVKDAMESGVDTRSAVDALIRIVARKTPKEFFSAPRQANLKPAYESLVRKGLDDTDINQLTEALGAL